VRLLDLWIGLLLVAAIFAVYSQVRTYGFVQYDDPTYVVDNPHVRGGLSADGLAWAFTSEGVDNWFPLTWLSHMIDCQLFGLASGWHHLTNVLLHAIATLLLFASMKRLTGARWPSAFVALVFALHPLHVESVAWIAERKDVLSACFWFLTLWCYARYVERPGGRRYLLVLAAFAGGLMAKPMVVTLPFVLLLLDYWPLRRGWRVREKVPFLAIAAGLSLVTWLVQRRFGAIISLASAPLSLRIENALISYLAYLGSMFWPSRLAVLYPYPHALPLWQWAASAVVLAAISVAVARQLGRRPYLAVGWCWYLGTLVPVIGLVQVGMQSRADRYTYIPLVGLSIILAWGGAELLEGWPRARRPVIAGAAVAGVACAVVSWVQLPYWTSSETLFLHATQVTSGNNIMLHNLAERRMAEGRIEEARADAAEALRIDANDLAARVDLASALSRLGQLGEAEAEYRKALRVDGSNAPAHAGLGAALSLEQRPAEALEELRMAIRLKPSYADGHYNLAKVLASLGRNPEAAEEFASAVRLDPENADWHYALAMALAAQGKLDQAAGEFATEVRLRPGDPNARYNLAIALARLGRLDEAIAQFSEALRLRPDFEAARKGLEIAEGQRQNSARH
jgi:Tfp pilus assembly protein PilF